MTRTTLQVGPTWPPSRSAYDYTLILARSDWAWEGLRRNQDYHADAVSSQTRDHVRSRLATGVHLTRMLTAAPLQATSWGLRPFRRSATGRASSATRLAGARRLARADGDDEANRRKTLRR